MQAIIPAAGMGRRLKELTKNHAKCMIEINGVTLIERMLRQLDRLKLSCIVIIVGYHDKKLIEFIGSLNISTKINYVKNSIYYKTNNIYSLYLAKNHLTADDTIILESDLILDDGILEELIKDERSTLALVDKYENWMDGTVVKIDGEDYITDMISGNKMNYDGEDYYKTVNIYKFSKNFSTKYYIPFLEAYLQTLGNNQYYEQVLRIIAILDNPAIKAKRLNGQAWYEIDNIQDMDIVSTIFEPNPSKKLELTLQRYGGYWRFPNIIDFCYLVNPFFPPTRMLNEMKLNFKRLIEAYPSGIKVNSLLAAKIFGVKPEYIVVGNGASELIKALTGILNGNIGIIYPVFEEYPNRLPKERIIAFVPKNDDFAYSADDIINHFDTKSIDSLLLVNPDNPTGNYIRRDDMLKLVDWAGSKNIKIIIDESFADFADEYPNTLIDNNIMKKHNNLIIVKSISKSCGVPGLRLGILASCDHKLIETLKKDVAIWNINSFAEFYMQIEEKYRADYENSLAMVRKARANFASSLKTIANLRIIPSQANYITAEVLGNLTAKELASTLLAEFNILIKDLSAKPVFESRQFIRIAVKTEKENEKLCMALSQIIN